MFHGLLQFSTLTSGVVPVTKSTWIPRSEAGYIRFPISWERRGRTYHFSLFLVSQVTGIFIIGFQSIINTKENRSLT